jgi:hypothetical protein
MTETMATNAPTRSPAAPSKRWSAERALFAALVLFAAAPAHSQTALADLSWLKGCWRAENANGAHVTEVWSAPPMPAMLGYAYAIDRNGRLAFWEHTRIEVRGGETPVFVAMPAGGTPVRFPLAESGPGRAAFENPAHDFPKRVEYARAGDDLTATVSAPEAPQQTEIIRYRRIACDPSLTP